MKRITIILSFIFVLCMSTHAQIGYQVAILNSATGEPRANESVKVDLSITNSAGGTIFSGSQTAMTNEFGIASLAVGNSETFSGVDWNKLPLYISATVDGHLISKTQILSVPLAEYAKTSGNIITEDMLLGTWAINWKESGPGYNGAIVTVNFVLKYTFSSDGTVIHHYSGNGNINFEDKYNYYIQGDKVYLLSNANSKPMIMLTYFPQQKQLLDITNGHHFSK